VGKLATNTPNMEEVGGFPYIRNPDSVSEEEGVVSTSQLIEC